MPMGTLTKKTHRHDRVVTNSPPSTGPRAGATAVGTVRMLEARTRSSGGKVRNSMAMPTGVSMPPPTPWMTRKKTSSERLPAMPHRADAPVNRAMASRSIRLDPNRSPSQPAAGMNTARLTRYPTATESSAVSETLNCRPMEGRATLTMVMSMMFMNMAATKTTLTLILGLMRIKGMAISWSAGLPSGRPGPSTKDQRQPRPTLGQSVVIPLAAPSPTAPLSGPATRRRN